MNTQIIAAVESFAKSKKVSRSAMLEFVNQIIEMVGNEKPKKTERKGSLETSVRNFVTKSFNNFSTFTINEMMEATGASKIYCRVLVKKMMADGELKVAGTVEGTSKKGRNLTCYCKK